MPSGRSSTTPAATRSARSCSRRPGAGGYTQVQRIFGASGQTLGEQYLDEDGNLTPTSGGYARWRAAEHDEFGNLTLQEYLGESGQILSKTRRRFAGVGLKVEEAFVGPDGEPAALASGFARVTLRYRRRQPFEIAYFGEDGKPVRFNGYAVLRNEYL